MIMGVHRPTNTIHSKPSSKADSTTRMNTTANSYLPNAKMLIINCLLHTLLRHKTHTSIFCSGFCLCIRINNLLPFNIYNNVNCQSTTSPRLYLQYSSSHTAHQHTDISLQYNNDVLYLFLTAKTAFPYGH